MNRQDSSNQPSRISKTAVIYDAKITSSIIGDHSCIADDSIVFKSKISNHCKIDRRNLNSTNNCNTRSWFVAIAL